MAFVFTLDRDDLLVSGANKEDEELASVDIGYDDATQTTYKALVALTPVTAHPPSYRELFFVIVEAESDGALRRINNGLRTKEFLFGAERTQVLEVIGQTARMLVERCEVEVLVINTVETHLPDKALAKYEFVCEAIRRAGYSGGKVDSYHGSEQWQLKKN